MIDEIEVEKVGRLWIAHRRGPVAVFAAVHVQGDTRRAAVANLADTVASLMRAGARLARRPWVQAITDAKLREEIMRVLLTREGLDARDLSAKAAKELARIDVESKAAIEGARAGTLTGKRALRRVEAVKDRLDDLIQAPVIAAELREMERHPERLVTSDGITLAASTKRRRARRS